MNKKIAGIITTGLLAAGVGLAVQQPTAHASNGYTVVKSSFPGGIGAKVYHAKSFSKNAYVWKHLNHKEKAANLKNYPNTTWYRSGTIVLKHNGKNSVYYQVYNMSPVSKKLVTGYVWRGYLSQGYNPDFSKVKSILLDKMTNTDYGRFISQSPTQMVTRQVLSLFPNSKVTVNASLYALFRDTKDKPKGNVLAFKDVDNYLNSPNTDSNAQRVAKIKSMLLNHGVDLNKAYTIGIYMNGFNLKKNVDDPQQGLVLIEK